MTRLTLILFCLSCQGTLVGSASAQEQLDRGSAPDPGSVARGDPYAPLRSTFGWRGPLHPAKLLARGDPYAPLRSSPQAHGARRASARSQRIRPGFIARPRTAIRRVQQEQNPPKAPYSGPATPQPAVRDVQLQSATVFTRDEILQWLRVEIGQPLPQPESELGTIVEKEYREEGYTYARAVVVFEASTGTLVITVDEGRIEDIEFEGVSPDLARRMIEGFTVRAGDLFHRRTIRRALARLLEPTGGALALSTRVEAGAVVYSSRDLGRRRDSFELVDRGGRRVLVVRLRKRAGAVTLSVGTEGREDWYSPVDGFAPALGFGAMIFDPTRFNHTYLGGYVSYKFGPERAGYSFGLERSLTTEPRVTVGVDLHDLAASDDFWRLSPNEQSLVAFGVGKTFRDYYRRRGVQVHGAVQPVAGHEVLVAWRRDRHESVPNATDYHLFGEADEVFRTNPGIDEGKVASLVLRYTWDSRFARTERLQQTHHRHLADNLYGSPGSPHPGVRVEWTSEIASDSFGSELTFRRHILNARSYAQMSPLQRLHSRLVLGISDGALPAQRTFALGGVGSVRGYDFKEVAGDRMALVNLEYLIGFNRAIGLSAFFDAGRVYGDRLFGNAPDRWLKGVGLGVLFGGDSRVEFAWKLADIPDSFQLLARFSPTF